MTKAIEETEAVEATEASEVTENPGEECPRCHERMPVDPRFVVWCSACGWNADPSGAEPIGGSRIERARRRMAHRYGEELFAELAHGTSGAVRNGLGAAGVQAVAVSALVHGLTVVLVVLGLWLLIAGWGEGLQPVFAVILFGFAALLRPRFGRLRRKGDDEPVLERRDAPELFALLDEVAGAVGTTGVDVVVVGPEANASVSTYGVRQRRALRLGMSLWAILEPQERVALLGHEFGHYAHGDTRRSLWVGGALRSLDTWRYLLAPNAGETLMDQFVNVLTAVPRWTVHGVTLLLDQATLRAAQRAEYLADSSAAHVAGPAAAAALMDVTLCVEAAESALVREMVAARTRLGGAARHDDPAVGLWDRIAAQTAAVPDHERDRLRRVAELRGHSIDATHPPTHLRHRRLALSEPAPARLVLDERRAAAVDRDLAGPAQTVARQVMRDGHAG
ncbi:M48 family metallopeptidase [Streptomyces sp. NPDC048659]|uniref:M48 family metallopeptidase n=1 Tax=Streptomyces sp. NPDC048659 TaxID=3155489 RepID=UPI0034355F8A